MKTACKPVFGSRPGAGFTLLEIMVSLTIIAVLMVSLFRMQASSLDLAASSSFQNLAAQLAARQLAAITRDISDGQLSHSGEFDPPYARYEWTYRVSEVNEPEIEALLGESASNFKKIELSITGPDGTGEFDLVTYRHVGQ